ncbi:MAG: hypothetical protein JSW05_02305 [Candidatus Thorarchaeota archaeon]|nr:MAG: hypothetical protein JSW05_02305 [Candidatus Thorarchaeota archaeon]
MESTDTKFTKQWQYGKISQWTILTLSLMALQLTAGGPVMPHTAAIAALIAALVSMTLLLFKRFTNELLALFSFGGILIGLLLLFGLLYGGFIVVVMAAIVILGGVHWIGVYVPEIVLFSGNYWILLLAFVLEGGMMVWNLDLVTRVAHFLQTNRVHVTTS